MFQNQFRGREKQQFLCIQFKGPDKPYVLYVGLKILVECVHVCAYKCHAFKPDVTFTGIACQSRQICTNLIQILINLDEQRKID